MKKAIVASFPRSGTHFLMNSLALNFGYVSEQFIDLDWFVNPYVPSNLWVALCHIRDNESEPVIVKLHHDIEFFGGYIANITEAFNVFYIHRDPEDALNSYCKHIWDINKQHPEWIEGPLKHSGQEFAMAEPLGGMLRYQCRQYPTMLDKWKAHTYGWMESLFNTVKQRIIYVRYEDLWDSFDGTIPMISGRLVIPCESPKKPPKDVNVVEDGMFKREGKA